MISLEPRRGIPARSANSWSSSYEVSLTRWHHFLPRHHQRASSIRIATPSPCHTLDDATLTSWPHPKRSWSWPGNVTWATIGACSTGSCPATARSNGDHTATHVAWVIRHIEELAAVEHVDHLDEVVAAAFYHDAVYEPAHPANERASARLARRDLATLGWSNERIERVAAMIEATAHGDSPTRLGDTASCSTPISPSSAPTRLPTPPTSERRAEFRHVDDDAWRIGRASVVRDSSTAPTIYSTATARGLWEQHARANLAAELAALS